MKSLDDFKHEYAIEKGFKSWNGFRRHIADTVIPAHAILDDHLTKVSGNHAAHVWQQAIAAQKVKCAEEAKINSKQHPDWDGWGIMPIISEIDKDSILNAPDAVNPFKK